MSHEIYENTTQNEVKIRGKIRRIIFQNPSNDYFVIELENGIVLTGEFGGSIEEGLPILAIGEWVNHPKYGPQVRVSYFEVPQDVSDTESLISFLAWSLRGIGKHRARLIVNYFKDKTLQVLDENPDVLLEIPGIGPKTLQQIKKEWNRYTTIRKIFIKLSSLGLSFRMAKRVYQHFGEDALDIILENPYRLTEVPLIGFRKADEIARKMGISLDDPRRVKAGIVYLLDSAANSRGHVYLPGIDLIGELSKIGISDDLPIGDYIDELQQESRITVENGRVYLSFFHRAEEFVASRLRKMAQQLPLQPAKGLLEQKIKEFEDSHGIKLSRKQTIAVNEALTYPVYILGGYAGTGKTTITTVIIDIAKSLNMRVCLCAPTGKAAKRLQEVTGYEAKTIHRMLKFDGKKWFHNEDNPLECDVVIVDEVSMVDLPLFYRLLLSLRDETRLILVGDPAQLPPVGPGKVLSDLLNSGVIPHTVLTEIFRQKETNGIVYNANAIRMGKWLEVNESEDFKFVQVEQDTVNRITTLATRIAQHYGKDFQFLTGMRKGPLGVHEMNRVLRSVLNPTQSPTVAGFKPGDKVIQVVNNYDTQVFNGEIGYVIEVNPEDGYLLIDFGDSGIVEYDRDDAMENIELAYALTVHKFQGSESPVVLLPVITHQYVMLHRNWLYTAMTRASKLLILAGQRKALWMAIKNQKPVQRYSSLRERLRGT